MTAGQARTTTRHPDEGEPPLALHGRLLTLKHADTFGVFNEQGDILGAVEQDGGRASADGLFQDDTRILSRFRLTVGGRQPETLAAAVTADNTLLTVDLTTPPMEGLCGRPIPRGQIHLRRRRYLWRRAMHEALVVQNYGAAPCRVSLALDYGADFLDLFEVRGSRRARRGTHLESRIAECAVTLRYEGLDVRRRSMTLRFSRPPARCTDGHAEFHLDLQAHGAATLFLSVHADDEASPVPDRAGFLAGLRASKRAMRHCVRQFRRVRTSNETFDRWLERASADLALLTTQLETGPYPYAGIPWFSVPFGRDAIITAFQTLWLDPSLTRGVLAFLAGNQATEVSAFRDSAPGKIMHETRQGEMARLDEVPFRNYFGGVDTTPLFVMLAGAYYRRSGDLDTLRGLWPSLCKALAWIDGACRASDGFLAYARGEDTGLQNQGWKDSHDSVFHADGRLAEGPIALVEVQGYVYAARLAAAEIAEALGEPETAAALREAARDLQRRFEEAFWLDDLGTYALALDGHGQPCRVRSSNAGHALFTGIADPARAARVMDQLSGHDFFTGWGVRTVAAGEARYNPMSYHNGAVWPHDGALIGAGMARYGRPDATLRILGGLFDAAQRFPDFRLPELFCGFRRRTGEAPAAYPSACVPQAWASGAPFLLLQACLGLEIDGLNQEVRISRPSLPRALDSVTLTGLPVGNGAVSIQFGRSGAGVEASLLAVEGDVRPVMRLGGKT